jgi:hypothetical protein
LPPDGFDREGANHQANYQCFLSLTTIPRNVPKIAQCFLSLTDRDTPKYQCFLSLTKKAGGGMTESCRRRARLQAGRGVGLLPRLVGSNAWAAGYVSNKGHICPVLGLCRANDQSAVFTQNQPRAHLKVSPTNAIISSHPITHAKSITYSRKYFRKSRPHPFTNSRSCGTFRMLCCSVVALDQKHLGCGARSAAFFVSGRSTHPNGENGSRIKLH